MPGWSFTIDLKTGGDFTEAIDKATVPLYANVNVDTKVSRVAKVVDGKAVVEEISTPDAIVQDELLANRNRLIDGAKEAAKTLVEKLGIHTKGARLEISGHAPMTTEDKETVSITLTENHWPGV